MCIRSYREAVPQLDETVYVADTARVIGDVVLGSHSSVWPMTVVRGDVNFIRIGSRTNIQDLSMLHVTSVSETLPDGIPLIIGDGVTVTRSLPIHLFHQVIQQPTFYQPVLAEIQ